jgi:hypothetical protein
MKPCDHPKSVKEKISPSPSHREIWRLGTLLEHRLTNAGAEGLNGNVQMVKEMACGFLDREHYKIAIYFRCGGLDLHPRVEALA